MSQGGLPAVVFDTMILYQATASLTGPAAELLRRLEAGQFILYVSDEILDEAHDVLSRPKLRSKNPRVTDETVRETFDLLDRLAQTVSDVLSLFSMPRDPDYEPYLNLAIATDADYLGERWGHHLMAWRKNGWPQEFIMAWRKNGWPQEFQIHQPRGDDRKSFMIRSERRSRNEISVSHVRASHVF